MAIDILLDDGGDIDLSDNQTMKLTSTVEQSSKQQVLISLRGYRGEWVFNVATFPPYLANDNNPIQLLGKSSQALVDFYIKDTILSRENITEIISYSSSQDKQTRQSTVSFKARTNSGDVISVVDAVIG